MTQETPRSLATEGPPREAPVAVKELSLSDLMSLGKVLQVTGFFRDLRSAEQAVAKILAGRELGLGPVQSLMYVYIVDGRPALAAALIAAKIKSSVKYDYRVLVNTTEACEIEFFEGEVSLGKSTFTMADAQAAKLGGKDNWRNFPRNMLFARALTNGARWYCPDAFGGPIYTPEELGAHITVDDQGQERVLSTSTDTGEAPEDAVPVRSSEPQAEQCPQHTGPDTVFFKRGNMRSYAHPVGPRGSRMPWCNWETVRDTIRKIAEPRVKEILPVGEELVPFVRKHFPHLAEAEPDTWAISDWALLRKWASENKPAQKALAPASAADVPPGENV